MLDFKLKKGLFCCREDEELISLHSYLSYFSLELGFLVCTFRVREEIKEKL